MKTAAVAFGLALGANAAPRPSYNPGECCFSINAWGAIGTGKGFLGQVKQLPDGQLRIGQTNLKNPSRFCLNRYDYGLKDQNGFGCILAGSVKQFQCDHGKPSWAGWDVLCDGQVAIRGDKTFSMCPTGDFGGYNIYTRPIPFQGGCIDIILTADQGQCRATCNPQPPKRLPVPTCQGPSCRPVSPPVLPPIRQLPPPVVPQRVPLKCTSPPCTPPVPRVIPPKCTSSSCTPKCTSQSCTTSCTSASCTPKCTSVSCTPPVPQVVQPKCTSPPCTPQKPKKCSCAHACNCEVIGYCNTPGCPNYRGKSKCPGELTGSWQFPHLIVPVNKNKPDYASGTSLFGTCSKTTVTYFNFDIPAHYQGKQCTLQFMFPQKSQLETSNFNIQGSGTVGGSWTKPVNDSTNYNNRPEITKNKIFHFQPGNNYVLDKVDCEVGVMTYALGGSADTYLHWFQDFNPCPIGLYITAQ
ncbi:Ubiquitin 3 binding protein But2 [Neofusicoccum parvum]|uniref:Ubiquitin 3 binding protein But2 n=1 Tax=Neofusicoccum parvum TaxID=310453 RepID=A0ACB5SD28_9PEZI|nr:Ubiquitin 3 binding protein But2 [Neofusicoccum parvum]